MADVPPKEEHQNEPPKPERCSVCKQELRDKTDEARHVSWHMERAGNGSFVAVWSPPPEPPITLASAVHREIVGLRMHTRRIADALENLVERSAVVVEYQGPDIDEALIERLLDTLEHSKTKARIKVPETKKVRDLLQRKDEPRRIV